MKATTVGREGGYRCVVCIKQVPDTKQISGAAMKADGTVNRAALPAIFNPEDRNALEAALRVREACGGTVAVVTMGLPAACAILRTALMCGADEAYLLTDRRAAGSDTLATSYLLSQAVRTLKPDLVFCGRQAIDGDTAQVGPQLAEKLKIPQLCYVEEVKSLEKGKVTVRRAIEGGYEILESPLPALLTVIDANEPRPMNAKRLMKYKRARTVSEIAKSCGNSNYTDAEAVAEAQKKLEKDGLLIREFSAADIDADPARIGFPGSPTKVKSVMSVVLTASEAKSVPATDEGIGLLIHELISDHTLG